MMIQWSDEDDCFLVGFPDFPRQRWRTHGDTYESAVANGIEALESLIINELSKITSYIAESFVKGETLKMGFEKVFEGGKCLQKMFFTRLFGQPSKRTDG
ncbi:type II toxin-antitoxin system HicB family antitoxin [Phormidesmis sp. 146-12]